eukprot:6235608-Alexandrium_andersonii.AAC.1
MPAYFEQSLRFAPAAPARAQRSRRRSVGKICRGHSAIQIRADARWPGRVRATPLPAEGASF